MTQNEDVRVCRITAKAFADLADQAIRISSEAAAQFPEVGGLFLNTIAALKDNSRRLYEHADLLEMQSLTDKGEAPCD